MLKVKDNIDLKELEKFGLEFKSDFYKEKESYVIYKEDRYGNSYVKLSINIHTRIIRVSTSSQVIDTLFELIQAGLIEKVDNTERVK